MCFGFFVYICQQAFINGFESYFNDKFKEKISLLILNVLYFKQIAYICTKYSTK